MATTSAPAPPPPLLHPASPDLLARVLLYAVQFIGRLLSSTRDAEAAASKKTDGASSVGQEDSLELAAAKSGSWRRILLLVFAITLHNIPEGLAVGVRTDAPLPQGSGRSLLPYGVRWC